MWFGVLAGGTGPVETAIQDVDQKVNGSLGRAR